MSGADTADSAHAHANDMPVSLDRPTFVTPRDFLEQGRPSLSRALTAIDKEQLDGLVSRSEPA